MVASIAGESALSGACLQTSNTLFDLRNKPLKVKGLWKSTQPGAAPDACWGDPKAGPGRRAEERSGQTASNLGPELEVHSGWLQERKNGGLLHLPHELPMAEPLASPRPVIGPGLVS